jgi:hypothetical protein
MYYCWGNAVATRGATSILLLQCVFVLCGNNQHDATKKWQGRDSVDNKPIGNKRTNSSLTLDEDWLICTEGF